MQHRPEIAREAVAEHLPRRTREAVRRLAAALLRIWLLVTPAALLADARLEPAWPALLLIAAGVGLSALALLRARPRPRRRAPLANLSAASNCVWKMDIEG